MESFSRLLKGTLSDGAPALFVEGNSGGGNVVTDILAWRYGNLFNITANTSSGVSEDTLRSYPAFSADINQDGITEVPIPRLLTGSSPEIKYYVIDWYTYTRYGFKIRAFTTYHDFSDGWYLILPDEWKNSITVHRQDTVTGERAILFYYSANPNAAPVNFLNIYTLSGDNKNDRAKLPGRFALLEHEDTIYCAEVLTNIQGLSVSGQQIISGFKLLYSDWATGVVS